MIVLPIVDPIAGYRPHPDGHDEMMDADGDIRGHWAGVATAYRALGTAELARRRDEIQMLLEQDGVTYNNPAEQHRQSRAWTLDPVPFIVPSDEWTVIERGIIQRAELLDLVLHDLYGERRLLHTGVVPPGMILSDPQFVRACDGIRLPGDRQLVVFGADLARSGDGRWMALGQRTQAPSGAAYAMENRRVMSRVFPHLFRTTGVQRLTPFIHAMRSALLGAVPDGVDDPSIVILSPGSLSETAFEHASIAAQLGYPLVQGSDLQSRNGRVGLRTVGGWVPVHVILRRVDAGFCDPLELRSDSTLGIPGLTDACRAGTVSVVNTLGSGVLENAGLGGLMNKLARHLLGSDLILESVPSWWCGDPASRSHVVAHLGDLVVRPLSRSTLEHSIDTSRASAGEMDELRRRILARPHQWVGQERIVPSSAPVLTDAGIVPRATVLRTFAVAHAGSYVAMPGGLARAGSVDLAGPITNLRGAESKDMWVLASDAAQVTEFWFEEFTPAQTPAVDALSARAAEHLFWLGRYAERAEATVRLIRTINARRDEFDKAPPGPGPASLTVLFEALTRITGTYPGFVGDDAPRLFDDPTDELFSLVVDERRPGTVAHAIRHMFESIDVVRDQLSIDTWLVVGSLQRELERLDNGAGDGEDATASVLDALLHGLLSLSGLANESMVRDQGWQFMEAGRRIERALHVTVLVGSTLNTEHSAPVESLIVESVLTAGESIITARRRYRSYALTSTTIDLLFSDSGNPRSLAFQLDRLGESLGLLRTDRAAEPTSSTWQLVDEVSQLVDDIDSRRLAHVDDTGYRPDLDRFVSTVRAKLSMVSNAVEAESFARFRPQHAMVGLFVRPLDTLHGNPVAPT
ncbi:MAG TPA: circularly permuted type 2 ATP-grasp protein [Ilumatobacteraceae bacterium]|nr:circularly permuted type 2 ATP-grasp protein [Ilumatobacteraceae bacterium]